MDCFHYICNLPIGVLMYQPTAREWKLIQEALIAYNYELSSFLRMGEKSGVETPMLEETIRNMNEINHILDQIKDSPRMTLVK